MKRDSMVLRIALVLFFVVLNLTPGYAKERKFVISEKISIGNLGHVAKDIRVWIPHPVGDAWQEIKDFRYLSPVEGKIVQDKKYGNDTLYIHSPSDDYDELEITIEFTVSRKEFDYYRNTSKDDGASPRFLKPDRLVFVDKDTRKLAREITKDKKTEAEKARAIYDYIIDEFTYTKDDPRVCKIGNSRLSLEFKKGQCSEYHSAFISLLRSLKIPVKFELGFSIPADKKEGVIGGYHCWAKFYTQDKGWFPVDISEADKNHEKKDYFFGRINENRVHLSTGRDIILPYARDKEAMPLNYFIYPYIEIDGQEFLDAKIEVSFADKTM